MRDPRGIEPLLDLIREIWVRDGDVRLGQIMLSAVTWAHRPIEEIGHLSDVEMLTGLQAMAADFAEMRARRDGERQ